MQEDDPAARRRLTESELRARWVLVAPHRDRLLAMARRCCATPQDAEDCVHEAMLRAVAYPDLDQARVGALLTSITSRLAVDMARRRGSERRGRPRLVTLPAQSAPPDEAVLDQDEARWLAAQIARLPEREREVFEQRSAGLSVGETASLLRISYKSVESAFTRARNRLRVWAAIAAFELASRMRRARSRPAVLTAALIASAGCLVAGTLGPGGGHHGQVRHGAAGVALASTGPGGLPASPSHGAAAAMVARTTVLAVASRRTAAGPRRSGGENGSPSGTFSFHTGPVHDPAGTGTGFDDLSVTVDPSGDPVSQTTNCIANFSLDPHSLGCPPS